MRLAVLSDANNAHTIRWVRALADRGHVILLFSLADPTGDWYAGCDITLVTLGVGPSIVSGDVGAWRKLRYLHAVPLLRRALARFEPDIVHAHYATSYGLLGLLCGRRPRIVSVWGMDVYDAASRSWILRELVRRVLADADRVLSTSEVMRVHARALCFREMIVTPFGVDVQRFAPSTRNASDDRLTVGVVKTLEPKYGIEYLVRAFARMLERVPALRGRVQLEVVGEGYLRSGLEALVRELGMDKEVRFAGRVPYGTVHRYHQSYALEVFPSIDPSESFGVSVVEAQACGVPVVVSNVGGLPEVIEPDVTGLVVPPRDTEALSEAMEHLLTNPASRSRMGAAGRARAVKRFSLDASVDQLEGIYRDVFQEKSSCS